MARIIKRRGSYMFWPLLKKTVVRSGQVIFSLESTGRKLQYNADHFNGPPRKLGEDDNHPAYRL